MRALPLAIVLSIASGAVSAHLRTRSKAWNHASNQLAPLTWFVPTRSTMRFSAWVSPDKTIGTASPDVPLKAVDSPAKPADTNWVVSETTSPVDYSSLIAAVIRSSSNVKDAPSTLAIRCRGHRAELLVRTQGIWRAARANELQVDYQIDDQPFVRMQWIASADRKAAKYKDDAVALLQSLPDGAWLKISVFDWQGPSHEASFELAGLSAVRQKIELACKSTPTVNGTLPREARSPQSKP